MIPVNALTGMPKTLALRAQLAGFEVRAMRRGERLMVGGRKRSATAGMSAFGMSWETSPRGWVDYVGWHRMPVAYVALIAALDASLAPASLDTTL